MNQESSSLTSRREFIRTSTAVSAGLLAAPFVLTSRSASPGETLKLGLIGCGGRGSGAAADALLASGNTVLYAMGDIFAPKMEGGLHEIQKSVKEAGGSVEERVQVPADRRFSGLDAFEKVIASGVDVVLLTTPPGFRPQHFKAAVEANKHCFLEKPVA